MKITQLEVKNFRILEDIKITLDSHSTIIVGRNNSGKTSLTEIFYKFFGGDSTYFRFEDFCSNAQSKVVEALELFKAYESLVEEDKSIDDIALMEKEYKTKVPDISLNIYLEYEESDSLASLAKFIMDLDPDRRDVLICCNYSINDYEKFFHDYRARAKDYNNDIISFFKDNFKRFYSTKFYAVDERNREVKMPVDKKDISHVFITSFIYAQRHLDDQAIDNKKNLSKGFENYYRFNKGVHEADIKKINEALIAVSQNIDGNYTKLFKSIFDDLGRFGIKEGVNLQKLILKSVFEPEKILKGNTQLFYQHDKTNLLPEAYNGLGYSNLIYMILQFISFYEAYDKTIPNPSLQLIFLEEPEAHLHPQMQYVFIKNINQFIQSKKDWNVQVVITTHSSHIIAESGFESIRYFDNSSSPLEVKNLSEFKRDQDKKDPDSIKFLKQYMSLNNCDMFFADKIIMVEGTVERVLLPFFIKNEHQVLMSKYISIIEVGGAYAHIFKELLNFINVKTLIITDIDSINSKDGNKRCKVCDGDKTSNAVLKNWIPAKSSLDDLKKCTEKDKIQGKIRVAYQIPEEGSTECGRSFEDAFILRNAKILAKNKTGIEIAKRFKDKEESDILKASYELADGISKTDFAFDIMLLEKWATPKYIKEGLTWLEN